VTTPENLDPQVEKILSELTGNGPAALQEIKDLFRRITSRPIEESIVRLTAETVASVRSTDEAKEGFAAFLEKRPANWGKK
jgi:methylglutaconyl-CoA hydratase